MEMARPINLLPSFLLVFLGAWVRPVKGSCFCCRLTWTDEWWSCPIWLSCQLAFCLAGTLNHALAVLIPCVSVTVAGRHGKAAYGPEAWVCVGDLTAFQRRGGGVCCRQ